MNLRANTIAPSFFFTRLSNDLNVTFSFFHARDGCASALDFRPCEKDRNEQTDDELNENLQPLDTGSSSS